MGPEGMLKDVFGSNIAYARVAESGNAPVLNFFQELISDAKTRQPVPSGILGSNPNPGVFFYQNITVYFYSYGTIINKR